MADEKKRLGLDEASAKAFEALGKLTEGKPEGAAAQVMLIVLAFATHNPLILGAQPLLERLLQRMNNKAGKDAVAALAMEVEKDEEIRRIAFEVREQLLPFLSEIYRLQQARGAIGVDAGTTMLNADVSVADALASVGVMLHRMEERLVNPEGCDPDRPLHDRLVLTGPTQTMRARAKSEGMSRRLLNS
jgi:hypothetical protein